jgi:hypothetical protein
MERDELEQTIAAEIRQAINDCLDTNKSISKSSHDCSGRILSLPEIKDGLTLRILYRDWNTTGRTYDKR